MTGPNAFPAYGSEQSEPLKKNAPSASKEHNCGLDKRSKKDNNAADHSICFQNAFITKAKAAQVIAPEPRFEGIEAGW